MFQANRKEWTELLTLMKLVGEGCIAQADPKGKATAKTQRLEYVAREEEQGKRVYRHTESDICIANNSTEVVHFDHDVWNAATAHAFELLRQAESENVVEVDDAMEAFLDEAQIVSIGGIAEGQHHLLLKIENLPEGTAMVLSRAGALTTRLIDGGRSANLKLEQTGTRFAQPMAAKVNYLESEHTIRDRMLLIERMGSSLRYNNVSDRVFRANLAVIDLHLGRLLTEMVRFSYLEDVARIDELVVAMRVINPLKVSTELIEKHHYYETKLRQLLMACACGMRPGKIYRGNTSLPPFVVVMASDATPALFTTDDRDTFADFLLSNTRLERGSTEKDKYGCLERENNVYYFKLNLKIALTKR